MRFDGIKIRGLGCFKDEVEVDFTALPGPLVAVCGANGSGKTSLLSMLHAGVYRDAPTRGSLVDLANARDASLEVRVTNGSSNTIRHTLDAVSKKAEVVVLDASGAPVLPDSKVTAFDAWVRDHFPPEEVVLASTFAAQESDRFVDLSPTDRKRVLSRVLRIEELEKQAEAARGKANDIRERLTVLRARLDALPDLDLDEETADLASAEQDAKEAEEALAAGRIAHQAALDYRAKAAKKIGDTALLADVEQRITNNRAALADEFEIRAAVTNLETVRATIADLGAKIAVAQREVDDHDRRAAEHTATIARAQQEAERAFEREHRLRKQLEIGNDILDAEAKLPAAREASEAAFQAFDKAGSAAAHAQRAQDELMLNRTRGLRAGLHMISVASQITVEDAKGLARETIEGDNTLITNSESWPKEKARLQAAEDAAKAAWNEATAKTAALNDRAGRRAEYDRAAAELVHAEAERRAAHDRLAEVQSIPAPTRDGAGETLRTLQDLLLIRRAEENGYAVTARRLAPLEAATTRLAELEPQAAALRAGIDTLEAELAAAPPPQDVALADLEATARGCAADVGSARARVAQAKDATEKRAVVQAEIDQIEPELSDWAILAEDLGASGLPALLIDAAGPELTALVNDLLTTCLGTRFSVSIETTKSVNKGKGERETCEIRVLDTLKGREGLVESLSGGERALVSESIALALSMLSCRRSGIDAPCLIRDESTAAFDPENASAYVALLRRAAEIIGASRVFFVSHNTGLADLADARIVLQDGKVSVS